MTNPFSDPKTAEILYDYFQGYVNIFNQGSYRDGFEDGINLVLNQLAKFNPQTNHITKNELFRYVEAECADRLPLICNDINMRKRVIESIASQKDLTPLALYLLIKTKYGKSNK